MGKTGVRELTEGEWVILSVVWELEPCAAPTVQEALQKRKKWAYSTVKTLMDRMVDKSLLKTERIRNLVLYRSTITRQQAQKREIKRTIKWAFAGSLTPMLHLLLESEDLTENQLAELEARIRSKRKHRRSRKKR